MKQLLYETVENVPPADKTDADMLTRYFVDADEAFFSSCEKELSKVNTFYSGTVYLVENFFFNVIVGVQFYSQIQRGFLKL